MLSFISSADIFSMDTVNDDANVCKCLSKMLNGASFALKQSTFGVWLKMCGPGQSQTERGSSKRKKREESRNVICWNQ